MAYALLAAAAFWSQWWPSRRVSRSAVLGASLYAVTFGATDEWHQSFVPGRDPSWGDFLADAAGAVAGALTLSWAVMRRPKLLSTLALLACACAGRAPAPTVTNTEHAGPPLWPPGDTVEVVHGRSVADPFRALEQASDEAVAQWTRAQDRFARSRLAALPGRAAMRDRIAALTYLERVGVPVFRGTRRFVVRKAANDEKGRLYWRPGPDAEERVLLDPMSIDPTGKLSVSGFAPSPTGRYLAYLEKRDNRDESDLVVLEVETGRRLPDRIVGVRYTRASWTHDEAGFLYTGLPDASTGPAPKRLAQASVRYHRLGTPVAQDTVVRAALGDATRWPSAWVSDDGRRAFLSVARGWSENEVWFMPLGPGGRWPKTVRWRALHTGGGSRVTPYSAGARVTPYSAGRWILMLSDQNAPRRRLLAVDPRSPGTPWVVVPEAPDAVLKDLKVVGTGLVLAYERRALSHVRWKPKLKGPAVELPMPHEGALGSGFEVGPDKKAVYFSWARFEAPEAVLVAELAERSVGVWHRPSGITLPDASLKQVTYRSRDGTEVPMFLVARKDALGRGRPAILYGYGGFNISTKPRFRPWIAAWIERGGVFAAANIRGGGELGEAWHQAGMRDRKQNVFDDFIAAAEYLIASGHTTAERLGIYGRSNGGLLVGAVMTQRPDLVRAVLCGVPLLDMLRYHRFGTGQAWVPEYGSADSPEDVAYLLAYSPYHRVRPKTRYPRLLMLSADTDDRVDPLHARKFVARIQHAAGTPGRALLRVEANSGHGGSDVRRATIARETDMLAFMSDSLGLD